MSVITALAATACTLAVLGIVAGLAGRPAPWKPPARSAARSASLVVLGVLVALVGFAATTFAPPVRIPIAAVAALLGPGYAVLALRDLTDVIEELALALGISIALLALAGTAMVTVAPWEPVIVVAAASVVIAPVLTWRGALGVRAARLAGSQPREAR